ncbi:MAG: hypothetical protein UZ21_OP11001000684 [Microgenomates bacterium OLB22]|nr:MAG: hypothetical protein UZ21_OP11001000684 [Microgenomates bacterium OLB22]
MSSAHLSVDHGSFESAMDEAYLRRFLLHMITGRNLYVAQESKRGLGIAIDEGHFLDRADDIPKWSRMLAHLESNPSTE